MVTLLSGLFPIGERMGLHAYCSLGQESWVLITPIGLGKLFLWLLNHWPREFMLTS